jgi:hypothetical protein
MKPTGNSDASYNMEFDTEMQNQLMNAMNFPLRPAAHVAWAQIQGIIDTVRNTVLDWSLKLESQGIMGEGMTFSKEEKAAAGNVHYEIQNLIHNMSNSQIQQDTSGSSQTIVAAQIDLAKALAVMEQLRIALDQLGLSGEQKEEVAAEVATVEAQAKSPKPKFSVIRGALRSVRSVLENAGGTVLGTEILLKIKELIL